MKRGVVYLFLLAILGTTYFGLRNHFGMVSKLTPKQEEPSVQKKLGTLHSILQDQMFIALVMGDPKGEGMERNVTSLLDQTYPRCRILYLDQGLSERQVEKAKELAKEKGKEIEWIQIGKKPLLEVLYGVIGHLDPHDIVALIDGKDWLSHENVFDHLNSVYANPEVWMTSSRSISHPNYYKVSEVPSFKGEELRKDPQGRLGPLFTFYAGLFHRIRLQDFLYDGEFIASSPLLALTLPLVEMGTNHLLFMDEVSYVKNEENQSIETQLTLQKVAAVEAYLRSMDGYAPLSQLVLTSPAPTFHRYKTDVVLFSEDRPLHLYACLESLFAKGRDINEVYVLYQGDDHEFQRAYLNLQNDFQTVHFYNVCDYPGNDALTLLNKVLKNRRHASPYVVFGEDRLILEERIRFHDCIEALEKAHADHFLLSLEVSNQKELPKTIAVREGIYAFQLGKEGGSHPPFTFFLCRKNLFENLEGVSDLNAFKKLWVRKLQPQSVALFYDDKKLLPLQREGETSLSQKKEWGHRFIEGYKIDLPSLTLELDAVQKGEFPLIKRERKRAVIQSEEVCTEHH